MVPVCPGLLSGGIRIELWSRLPKTLPAVVRSGPRPSRNGRVGALVRPRDRGLRSCRERFAGHRQTRGLSPDARGIERS